MTLLAKIHQVRQAKLAVVKTGEIKGGKNTMMFASYADIWSALHPVLDEAGISVGWEGSEISMLEGGREKVRMVMAVSDGNEVERVTWEMLIPEPILNSYGSSVTNNAQRTANASSYCKRLGLLHMFGVAAGNEDDVERMTPQGDQSNIPGLVRVTPSTQWPDLIHGGWENVETPTFEGMLIDHATEDGKALSKMMRGYPDHPGLVAWAHDRLMAKMQANKLYWEDIQPADAPDLIQNCTGAHLMAANLILAEKLKSAES